jgi:hypothetical protein
MPKKTPAQHFRDLFARFTAGSTPQERATGERMMDQWLKRHGKSRIDIPSILAQAVADDVARQPPPPPSDPRDAGSPPRSRVTVLDLVHAMAEDYLVLSSPHEYVAYALWAVHTHVYELFEVTPRLVLTSPTGGCGKSRGLKVLDRLVARPKKSDNFTAATIYDSANDRRTVLVDEADNLDFDTKGAMRAVFNSGYERGGMFARGVGKHRREYQTFAPLAMASIGVLTPPGTLPSPLMRRSIIILMQKRRPKRRFRAGDTGDLDLVYQHIRMFAREATLNLDPELPSELEHTDPSLADNWRVLISIADACSPAWGVRAREAAIFFARSGRHEELVATLLRDIRTVFDVQDVDRIGIKALVAALHNVEGDRWSEFSGVKRNLQPHKLRESELRAMLRPLGIFTHSIWPQKGRPGDDSVKGYTRADFEAAWRAYCGEEPEPGKPAKVVALKAP